MSLITETEQLSRLSQLLQSIIDIVPTWVEGQLGFATIADLISDQVLTAGLADGRIVRVLDHGGFDLQKVSGGQVDYTAASGARFRVITNPRSPLYFGAVGDGVANDTAALLEARGDTGSYVDLRGRRYRFVGTWGQFDYVFFNGQIIDNDRTWSYAPLTAGNIATIAEGLAPLVKATEGKLVDLQTAYAIIQAALAGSSQTVQGRLVVTGQATGSTVANTWTRRNLNFVESNTISGASLVNNQVILPAGRYRLRASLNVFNANHAARCRIRNVSNLTTLAESMDYTAFDWQTLFPTVDFEVVLAATTTLELQYLTNLVRATDGLGRDPATSPPRYAIFEATKVG